MIAPPPPRVLDSIYVSPWSYRDPLCQSQSLPYLEGLGRAGWRIGLITYEQPRWKLDDKARGQERERLAGLGLRWFPVPYHKKPPVLSTFFDIGVGGVYGAFLARRFSSRLLHGRSSVAGAVAMLASKLAGKPFFYDADGDLAEEYVDVGAWAEDSLPHRLTRLGQDACFRAADAVAVLTEVRKQEVSALTAHPVTVLPCAVDTSLFSPRPATRDATRSSLGLTGLTFVYLGKLGGRYDLDTALRLVAATRAQRPDTQLLVVSNEAPARFIEIAQHHSIKPIVISARRDEVPTFLSAADVGLSILSRLPCQRHSSLIKSGEYLACGLPIVASPGSGDYDALLAREGVGITLREEEYGQPAQAAARLLTLLATPGLQERCRNAACAHVGLEQTVLPRYRRVYRQLLGSPD